MWWNAISQALPKQATSLETKTFSCFVELHLSKCLCNAISQPQLCQFTCLETNTFFKFTNSISFKTLCVAQTQYHSTLLWNANKLGWSHIHTSIQKLWNANLMWIQRWDAFCSSTSLKSYLRELFNCWLPNTPQTCCHFKRKSSG